MGGLTTTTILYVVALPVLNSHLSDWVCDYQQYDDIDGHAIEWKEDIFLIFLSLLQMTPCVYLSFAFYYLPTVERVEAT